MELDLVLETAELEAFASLEQKKVGQFEPQKFKNVYVLINIT